MSAQMGVFIFVVSLLRIKYEAGVATSSAPPMTSKRDGSKTELKGERKVATLEGNVIPIATTLHGLT